MPALLGLDVATHTGWAIKTRAGVTAGTWKPPHGVDEARVFFEFQNWLHSFMGEHEVFQVAMEEPLRSDLTRTEKSFGKWGEAEKIFKKPITNVTTLRRLYGMVGAVKAVCHARQVPLVEVNQAAWRSHWLGVTRAPRGTKDGSKWLKDQSVARATRVGIAVDSDNAADAVGVLEWLVGQRQAERAAKRAREAQGALL